MRLAPFVLIGLLGVVDARAEDDCGLEDPAIAAAAPAVPERARRTRVGGAFLRRPRGGALAGKTIYVSAGHGWYWSDTLGRWATQRGNTHDVVEDLVSTETVSQHLIPYLWDMGAYVVPVREASMQTEMVIGDDPVVSGAATDVAEGWATPAGPLAGDANPFAAGGSITLEAGGVATWTLDVAVPGEYDVYVAWVQGPDRAAAARYVIRHAGGESEIVVDQRRHGSTWVLLGRFGFDDVAEIELSGDAGVLSADAVRLGGGTGHVDRGAGASGRPAYEDAARYAAQWNGAPSTVWDYTAADNSDDVGTRSRFAAWDHEDGEDAVYVAWHTNAPSPARGTSSFAYGPDPYGDLSQFSGVPGSLELMDAIHREIVDDVRAVWEAGWQDRGQHTAYFGEVNPSHNPEMPATLIEVAFHDTLEDADALRDPRFRRIAARAIAHGIARYFAARDGAALVLPPEPPSAVRMVQGEGGVRVAWDAPEADPAGGDAAAGYRVYLSRDGRAFDDGRDVAGTSLVVEEEGVWFARVTAVNEGGESRPSPVVGAVRAPGGRAKVLVVAAFERIDGAMMIDEDLAAYDLGVVDRGPEDRINDESHAARHGLALAGAGYSFDVATADAVRSGAVALDGYEAVSWLAGEELAPLAEAERGLLAAFLDGGGAVIVSGTDVARALAAGEGDAPALLARLGVALVADDAEAYGADGVGALDGVAVDFGDRGPGGYDADACDVIDAVAPGAIVLAYDGGAGAGVLTIDDVAGRSAVLGFPIETIGSDDERAALMAALLAALAIEPDEPEVVGGDVTGCCSTGRGDSAFFAVVVLAVLLRRRRA